MKLVKFAIFSTLLTVVIVGSVELYCRHEIAQVESFDAWCKLTGNPKRLTREQFLALP